VVSDSGPFSECLLSTANPKTAAHIPTELEDIEAAINQLERSLLSSKSREEHQLAFQAVHYDRLADLYYAKYEATGNQNDYDAAKSSSKNAVNLGREATQNPPPGLSKAAQWYALQGSRLALRHERFGEMRDLDEAVDVYEAALKTVDQASGLRSVVLMNQANCLCTKYEDTGLAAYIEDAIGKSKEAFAMAGSNTATIQNDMSTMYLSRYEKDRKLEDLDEALQLSRAAVTTTSEEDSRLPTRLLNLANVLNTRYKVDEKMTYIEEMIRILERAERVGKASSATCLPQILSRHAHALYIRYTRTTVSADVLAALKKGKEGLDLVKGDEHHEVRRKLNRLVHTCSEEARELEEGDEEVQEKNLSVEV